MNTLQITRLVGEMNSLELDGLAMNGVGGDAELVVDSMGEGEAYAMITARDSSKAVPRVSVPAETRTAKVG